MLRFSYGRTSGVSHPWLAVQRALTMWSVQYEWLVSSADPGCGSARRFDDRVTLTLEASSSASVGATEPMVNGFLGGVEWACVRVGQWALNLYTARE
jgi:hypothetical protein